MSVSVINGSTVMEFVEDDTAFNKCVEEYFTILDVNGDGVLSRDELRKGFNGLMLGNDTSGTDEEVGSLYDIIFDRFDSDNSGTIDLEEFRSEMKEFMTAVARGIGNSSIQVVLETNSFLMRALEHGMAKQQC